MKKVIFNLGYFVKEAKRTIQMNIVSNIFSFIGTVLILFLLALVVSGWSVSERLIQMLKEEAEISAYYNDSLDTNDALSMVEYIKTIDGVQDARLVGEEEAYARMKNILGEEAKILELYEENPFKAYIEVGIELDKRDAVLEKVSAIDGIEYVRDNREVLERVEGIIRGLKTLGLLVIAAVGIATLVIISHMIRQGIYNNREQINTLRFLGASDSFIGFPFLITGLLTTVGGGILASVLIVALINVAYGGISGTIPFLPLPPKNELTLLVVITIMAVSAVLGILGSLFGLSSIKSRADS